jgi:hypothetical protein
MRPAAATTGTQSISMGLIVAMFANAVFLAVAGFTNESLSGALVIGSGVTFFVGVLLMLPRRTWLVGVGIAVGVPVVFTVDIVILIWLAVRVTY